MGFGLALGMAVWFVCFQAEGYVLFNFRWPGSHPRVPFYVSTNMAGHAPYNGPLADGIRAITNAANVWNTQGASNLKFFYAGTTEVTNAGNDGINVILYDPSMCTFVTGCIGKTIIYHDGSNIVSFDTILNGKSSNGSQMYWSASSYPDGFEEDMWSIILHELGHVAGLDHSNISQAVMGFVPARGSTKRNLGLDDIQGIQAANGLYTDEGLWASTTTPAPGQIVIFFLDYPEAANKQYQIVADFDRTYTGCAFREKWSPDSRIFPLDRCPSPIGSQIPTALEAMVLSANTGVLDSNGQAQVTVQIPETFACFPTNRQWHFAVVTYDSSISPSGIEDVGVALTLNLQASAGPSLLVRSASLPGTNQAEVRWQTRSNHSYQMERSTTLTNWTSFGPVLSAPPGGWLTGMVSLAQSAEFFRVREQLPSGPPCTNGALAIVVSTNNLFVPEGSTNSFTVQLNMSGFPPTRWVEIARTGGDTSLQTSGDTEHSFHNNDWNVPRTFTISASPDADADNGVATFTITGDDMSSVTVTVEEVDDDSP